MKKLAFILLPLLIILFACQSKQTPVKTEEAPGDKKPAETFVVEGEKPVPDVIVKDANPAGKKPKEASTLFHRGLELIQGQKYEEGIDYLNRALETDPKNGRIYFNRGFAYYSLKKYDEALADFLQSQKINPSDTMSLLYSGLTKYYKNDFQGAMEDYTKAIQNSNKFPKAYYNRGIARGQLKDYKGAIEDFTNSIKMDPHYPEAYYNRGLATFLFKKDTLNACLDWTRAAGWGSAPAQKALDIYCKTQKIF